MTAPMPAPAVAAVAPVTFSQHCEAKMWQLMKDSDTQVGSHYIGDGGGRSPTDCITYVRQVLEYGFGQVGQADKVRGVHSRYEKGTDLARYLVSIGWSAYYWNPDVKNPRDGSAQHPVSYKLAVESSHYYTVPIETKMIINYNRTPSSKKPNEMDAFLKFSKVRFSFGLARGGDHTFLLSYGMLFQVHWDKLGAGLYERSAFYDFEWLDGIVVVPPDAGFTL